MLDVRDLLRRANVIELGVAFGLAYALVGLVQSATGFVLNAIWFMDYGLSGDRSTIFGFFHSSAPPYSFAGGSISYGGVLHDTLAIVVLVVIVRWITGWARDCLWDDTKLRDCPFCLSPIPVAASVCESCTRDVAPA